MELTLEAEAQIDAGHSSCNTFVVRRRKEAHLRRNPWTSLVEGDEGSYLPNCQSNLIIFLHTSFLLFCSFINTKVYLWAEMSTVISHLLPLTTLNCGIMWLECGFTE